MTSLGTCRFRRDAGTNLRAPPTRVIARRPKADAAISSRHLRLRRGFPVLRPVLRDCRALLRKARNDKLGCLSHSEGRSAELAIASLPCHCEEGASPTRQSQVGTFDFAGAFPCSGRYCEIAAPCSARLAMTNLGAFPIRRGAAPSLRVPPSRVIPWSEATWESHAGTCGFAEVRLSPPLRQYIA